MGIHTEARVPLKHGSNSVLIIARESEEVASRRLLFIHRRGEELFVRVGSYKRNLILPQTLKRLSVREANLTGDRLEISFGPEPVPPSEGG